MAPCFITTVCVAVWNCVNHLKYLSTYASLKSIYSLFTYIFPYISGPFPSGGKHYWTTAMYLDGIWTRLCRSVSLIESSFMPEPITANWCCHLIKMWNVRFHMAYSVMRGLCCCLPPHVHELSDCVGLYCLK